MPTLIPSETRLSEHFLLSDMIGCHSVYSLGLRNRFEKQGVDLRLENGKALCTECLEPLLHAVGSFSISYGFISPELSSKIITYQDWRKPSHHRWDLGAAVDIKPHYYLQTIAKSPIEFVLEGIFEEMPMSRVITYSESPFICVAVAAIEVLRDTPRRMFYENEYQGVKGAKPAFRRYASASARAKRLEELKQSGGLQWVGHGYPTHHGGGRRQYQHMQCSEFTVVSDFLYDELSVMEGYRNIPQTQDPSVAEAFRVAGRVYDRLLDLSSALRLSIVSAYTSHTSEAYITGRDWRGDIIEFEVVPPEFMPAADFIEIVMEKRPEGFTLAEDSGRVIVSIERRHFSGDQQRAEEVRVKTRKRPKTR